LLLTGLLSILALHRSRPASTEARLKPYPRIERATKSDRILIVAPHIDDESIGAAGYATDAIESGAQVYVVFLTAGDCNRVSARLVNKTLGATAGSYLRVGLTRIAEAKAAMQLLGVPEDRYFVLGYPDRGLRAIVDNRKDIVRSRGTRQRAVPYVEAMTPGSPYTFESVMSDMERVLEIARPTMVVAPVDFDLHADHSATAELTNLAIAAAGICPQRLGYLVHSQRIPTSLVRRTRRALVPPSSMRKMAWATYPLTPELQSRKDALIKSYKSQRPYTALLRNAFIRTNELFIVYDDARSQTVAAPADPRIAIAR
jgi:LmbE family N-acetylglucosaminyl deacetylase